MVGEIIKSYRILGGEGKPLTYLEFVNAINSVLPPNHHYTQKGAWNWEHGLYQFPYLLAYYLAHEACGWLRDFGHDILAALTSPAPGGDK